MNLLEIMTIGIWVVFGLLYAASGLWILVMTLLAMKYNSKAKELIDENKHANS